MKFAIIALVLMLVTALSASAYYDKVTLISPKATFATGLQHQYQWIGNTIYEDPSIAENALKNFKSDLDLDFWNDDDFHPAIFQDLSKYVSCGAYPTRLCLQVNEYGGFVLMQGMRVSHISPLIGYGAYDRMNIEYGKLYPNSYLREKILRKNLELMQFKQQYQGYGSYIR